MWGSSVSSMSNMLNTGCGTLTTGDCWSIVNMLLWPSVFPDGKI